MSLPAQPLAAAGVELLLQHGLESLALSGAAAAGREGASGARARPVVFFRADDTLRDVLKTLAEHRILSGPVLETPESGAAADEGRYLGFVDVAAVLQHVLASLPRDVLAETAGGSVDDCVRVMAAVSSLAEVALSARVTALSLNDGDLVYRGFSSCTLLDVVTAALLHPLHLHEVHICHRVAAADVRPEADAASSLSDVSARSMSIVAQTDVIRFLHKHVAHLGALADASVESLGLCAPDFFVFCVVGRLSALRTLVELSEHKLSAAGVLNDAGELVANLSVSDLRDVPADRLGLLALPVLQFLAVQAGCREPRKPVVVHPHSPLRAVLDAMVQQDVHHVYVVSPPGAATARQPIAVISPSDILFLFDTPPSEAAA